jgi:hypothetical protein
MTTKECYRPVVKDEAKRDFLRGNRIGGWRRDRNARSPPFPPPLMD